MDQVPTRLVRLPLTVPGMASVDENGEPMIYLNDRLTSAQHLRTYQHELQHIHRDDFFNALPIEVIEGQEQIAAIPTKPEKKPRKPYQKPNDHLKERFETVRAALPENMQMELDDLFSYPPISVEEIKLRGWILYDLDHDSPYWTQLLLTFAHYPSCTKMPIIQDRETRRLTKRTIPYDVMRRVMYALCGTIDNDRQKK